MTPALRELLLEYASRHGDPLEGAILAALAELDEAVRKQIGSATLDRLHEEALATLKTALVDLDACRAALGPVANQIRLQPYGWPDGGWYLHLHKSEANAVLAAAGEEEQA